jgi:hypothetical protein
MLNMRCIGKIAGIALLSCATIANAGLTRTTVHSRANCLNNESITWWYGHPYDWRVVSIHKAPPFLGGVMHHEDTGFIYNDRVAVVHWCEGMVKTPWEVWGYHYFLGYSKNVPFESTHATDCQIIEGW